MTVPRTIAAVALGAILTTVAASGHEVTYKGTVVEVTHNRYAASDGVFGEIEITVTPGARRRTFDITAHTRIWRGESPVGFSEARIQPRRNGLGDVDRRRGRKRGPGNPSSA